LHRTSARDRLTGETYDPRDETVAHRARTPGGRLDRGRGGCPDRLSAGTPMDHRIQVDGRRRAGAGRIVRACSGWRGRGAGLARGARCGSGARGAPGEIRAGLAGAARLRPLHGRTRDDATPERLTVRLDRASRGYNTALARQSREARPAPCTT